MARLRRPVYVASLAMLAAVAFLFPFCRCPSSLLHSDRSDPLLSLRLPLWPGAVVHAVPVAVVRHLSPVSRFTVLGTCHRAVVEFAAISGRFASRRLVESAIAAAVA